MGSFEDSPITTERLELMLLARTVLEDALAGRPLAMHGCSDPAGFLVGADHVLRLRLAQLDANPGVAPWLLRAIVLRDARVAVGFVGCHAEPDASGTVELGYEIHPTYRRLGYANEATRGLMAWAASRGVRTARVSVSPDNRASLAIASRLGFVQVGEQMDEVDGLELVFEKSLGPILTRV